MRTHTVGSGHTLRLVLSTKSCRAGGLVYFNDVIIGIIKCTRNLRNDKWYVATETGGHALGEGPSMRAAASDLALKVVGDAAFYARPERVAAEEEVVNAW